MGIGQQVVFLVKANDELISHCRCVSAFIGYPPLEQRGCSWQGLVRSPWFRDER